MHLPSSQRLNVVLPSISLLTGPRTAVAPRSGAPKNQRETGSSSSTNHQHPAVESTACDPPTAQRPNAPDAAQHGAALCSGLRIVTRRGFLAITYRIKNCRLATRSFQWRNFLLASASNSLDVSRYQMHHLSLHCVTDGLLLALGSLSAMKTFYSRSLKGQTTEFCRVYVI